MLKNIHTIIFDLGGVIIDLDVEKTIRGFSTLSNFSEEKVREIYATHPVFHDFEKGLVTDEVFRDTVRGLFNSNGVSDKDLDEAWNAMLLGIPKPKLDLLVTLRERYRVLILSNTNSIHVQVMNNIILPDVAGVKSFDPFVHKAYFSHDLRMRKPDAEIYQHVLDDADLRPEETLFLDDNVDNLQGAAKLGIRVKHVTGARQVLDLFD
ncbi:MAG TPA: HAD family phosphatase [Cyclobacteriaceae bacterium]|nr:HAD family phosphatase [Cyclobacteriaceae bacterium]